MNRLAKIIFGLLTLSLLVNNIYALGVSDFVPGFMTSGPTESADSNLPVRPLVDTKRRVNASNTWYCNRIKDKGGNNVFCKNNKKDTLAKVITYDESGGDRSQVVDMTNQTTAQTTANQKALLDQSTKNELDKSKGFRVPIKPNENVNVNVGQNKVDFNIKY